VVTAIIKIKNKVESHSRWFGDVGRRPAGHRCTMRVDQVKNCVIIRDKDGSRKLKDKLFRGI
jgi:hypothetical protein